MSNVKYRRKNMRYAIGDIHGMYAKMLKALENAGFDREKTLYIQ